MECVICGNGLGIMPGITCSESCHEELVSRLEAEFGKYKKIVRAATGEAFRVPLRDIVEKGIREQDLDQYPRWEED